MVMDKTYIILISGHAGNGKDTFAMLVEEEIIARSTFNVRQDKFAFGVKKAAELCGWVKDDKSSKGRSLLQAIGMAGREYHEDVWVEQVADRISMSDDFVIISDWRFPNECEYFEGSEMFSVVKVRIENSRVVKMLHPSEVGLDDYAFDYVYNNDYTMEYLRGCAKSFVSSLFGENE